MEKYYIIGNDTELGKEYWKYEKELSEFLNHANKFCKKVGISTPKLYCRADVLWICPDDEDKRKFAAQFTKSDLGKFKKTSPVGKAWTKYVKENNVTLGWRPMPSWYFNNESSRCSTRLFDEDGVIYCTFESSLNFSPTEEYQELKASEFYKIMEDKGVQL